MAEKEFAETLKECFLSVWVDEDSGFGTFPLESMACGVPVIGKVPNLQPDWMTENNGIWVTDKTLMSDYVADFIQNWLEDNIKTEIYDEGIKTSDKFKNKSLFEQNVVSNFESYITQRADSFELQIKQTN
jgi:glycosyltransferase involved in cell wall biosynthesis